jgi:biotin carboxyl carrier protein
MSFEILFDEGSATRGTLDGVPFELDMIATGDNSLHLILGSQSFIVDVVEADYSEKRFEFAIRGAKYDVVVRDRIDLLLDKLGMAHASGTSVKEVKAPMPGLVLAVLVQVGDVVQEGDKLLLLEAMKMENNIVAPTAGVVQSVGCLRGDAVEKGQVLVRFE